MKTRQNSPTISAGVIPLADVRAWLVVALFIAAAVILPAVCHITGLPVRWLLPMHWPIVLAGALYGWRGGLITGLLGPLSNYALTGYPLLLKLLPMTTELAVYGALTGWLIERGWNRFAAIGTALVAGRLVFLGAIILTSATDGLGFGAYISAAMLPGLAGGIGMAAGIPVLVKLIRKC